MPILVCSHVNIESCFSEMFAVGLGEITHTYLLWILLDLSHGMVASPRAWHVFLMVFWVTRMGREESSICGFSVQNVPEFGIEKRSKLAKHMKPRSSKGKTHDT